MKKLVLSFALLIACLTMQAQSVDDVPFSEIDTEYVQLVGVSKLFSNKVVISIDYGQERKMSTDTRVKDENGKVLDFNSMIDALNFMSKQGYEFVNAYTITAGNQNVYNYIMRKK